MRKNLILLILFCTFFQTISAQDGNKNSSLLNIFLNDSKDAFNLGLVVAAKPFRFNSSDWGTVAAVAGGTALLFTADKAVRSIAIRNQSGFANSVFGIDKFYGSGYTALFTAGIYGYGLFAGDAGIRNLGLKASEAFIISGAITTVLKVVIGRRRPYGGESNLFFSPPKLFDNDYQSLPSGHTTVAFAVSTVMAGYSDNLLWKTFWFGSAGLVALSRIYHNQHWVSDVFLGGAIGYFVGDFISGYAKGKSKLLDNLKIYPEISFKQTGFGISYRL
jgi:membrane-associated phospholipid phosphatase